VAPTSLPRGGLKIARKEKKRKRKGLEKEERIPEHRKKL
jgi:hypothetical protein